LINATLPLTADPHAVVASSDLVPAVGADVSTVASTHTYSSTTTGGATAAAHCVAGCCSG